MVFVGVREGVRVGVCVTLEEGVTVKVGVGVKVMVGVGVGETLKLTDAEYTTQSAELFLKKK